MAERRIYPVETWTNFFRSSRFEGKPDCSVLATNNEVKTSIRKKNAMILDARTKEEFQGIHVRSARAGHIPTAINIDWVENVERFHIHVKVKRLKGDMP